MATKDEAKQKVAALVEKFAELDKAGKLGDEANTKNQFIEPLFGALGWGMRSNEVIKEKRVREGKADYAFQLNDVIKFFVEAKPARSKIASRSEYARQARTYGAHKMVEWAVLTNFKTLQVFNCLWDTRNPNAAQVGKDLHYTEFVERFDELWLLSKESFLQSPSLLDRAAEDMGKRFKRISVAELISKDLLKWRAWLSKDYDEHHPGDPLTRDEVVQRTIDRIIFIRTCEDRELENKKLARFTSKTPTTKRDLRDILKEVYSYYAEKYDSDLFKPHEADKVPFSQRILHKFIHETFFTEDRYLQYDFADIDADVLGNAYEQYLGTMLAERGKDSKRKKQGIYYTPTYIVDYIVKNTLGELIKGKTPEEIQKIKILDPACGSGSFLIRAYEQIEKEAEKHIGDLPEEKQINEKLKLLGSCIHGVDLDEQAVRLTRLNLMLKTAEARHLLPMLDENIKCGNSLIDDPEVAGDKAFKWEREFPGIMEDGGFDVVIGNPPYVRQEKLTPIKGYLESHYAVYDGSADLFTYFFERELKLLKEGGYFGMIVSNKWLRAGYGRKLREFLGSYWIEQFIDFGDLPVFKDAIAYPCIIIIRNRKKQNPAIKACKVRTLSFVSLPEYIRKNGFEVDQKTLDSAGWDFRDRTSAKLLEKIGEGAIPIEKYVGGKIYYGIKTGLNKAFIIDEEKRDELIKKDPKSAEIIKPLLVGKDIGRYLIPTKTDYMIVSRDGMDIPNECPAVFNHLKTYEAALKKRYDKGAKWYQLRKCAYYPEFEKPKIVWGNLATHASFYFDEDNYYVNAPACILPTNSKYVLGVLNSTLMSYFLKSICAERQGGFIEQKPVYVSQIPIKEASGAQQNAIAELAEKMLELNRQLAQFGDKRTEARERLERQIAETDAKIDELVYELYGLTDEERKVIEESLG